MSEEHILGNVCEDKKYFDKQEIIVLYLGYEDSSSVSSNVLRILLDERMGKAKKKEELSKYGFEMSESLEEEVAKMCDYSVYLEQKYKKKYTEEGIYTSLCSLMKNMKINLREAMKLLNVPESEYEQYSKMLNKEK